MKIRYFAWVRERTGLAEEDVDLPAGVETASDLMRWLSGRGENYEMAFGEPDHIRIAFDQVHVTADARLGEVDEVAFFPPMTGG
ncbi:MAG: molybdopterin converting factor subunit 1 [Pseudomonadota bacterium]